MSRPIEKQLCGKGQNIAYYAYGLAKWLQLCTSDPNNHYCQALFLVQNTGEATILLNRAVMPRCG
jgi:hypothetical protein